MSEKRKPIFILFAQKAGQKKGKKQKVEIFKASDFTLSFFCAYGKKTESCYRIRVNGRWFPKGEVKFFWKSEIRDLFFNSIKF